MFWLIPLPPWRRCDAASNRMLPGVGNNGKDGRGRRAGHHLEGQGREGCLPRAEGIEELVLGPCIQEVSPVVGRQCQGPDRAGKGGQHLVACSVG